VSKNWIAIRHHPLSAFPLIEPDILLGLVFEGILELGLAHAIETILKYELAGLLRKSASWSVYDSCFIKHHHQHRNHLLSIR
jgi:hypothetical protein